MSKRRYFRYLRVSILLSFIPVSVLPMAAQAQTAADNMQVEYTFKRGDTLIALSEKYMRKRSDYVAVQRLNRIANPRFIPIGKTVSIPFRLLKYRQSEASLSAFRGNVVIAADGQAITPVQGLEIGEGSRLATSAGSFLTLQLEDGSRISMPSNSKMRITRLRHILLTDSIDYELAVDSGRVRSKITPFDKKADRYRVRTPVAVSAVRGTDYRTRVDEETGTAFSETVEGSVEVAAGESFDGASSVSVPAGTGAAATVTGELAMADLLTPPELVDPAKVQSEDSLDFVIAPRPAAKAHRILISSDAGFVDIVAEQRSESNMVSLDGLADGRYFGKATAFDEDGFEGMPETYSFKRQLSTLSGSADSGDFGYRFKWIGAGSGKRTYRFQLMLGSTKSVPIVDEAGLTRDVITLSDLPDGEYYWRVGVTQYSSDPEDKDVFQKWTDYEKLTVAG
ncbi:FecR family protein [Parasphingorhabdus cellanae]|uniref:FecR domain-containing protein n=1 Tax=Parasphingorhabdus cellanae TaxID=2806553 RepID=A0ABX7T6V8_9SPHN|nr:FecR domain-containing protein [Parasphingorhabdus cellanae]QTD57241.1 FecR domain-containing protein [Parasphingorhabdus cellanae]